MNSQNFSEDLSYFRLSLLAFLRESHPDLLNDRHFISVRVKTALNVHAQAVRNGSSPLEAEFLANEVLFQGLHFSKHDILKNILWNEFSREIPEDEAKEMAIQLLPKCASVFAQYPLSDDFAISPEYDLLYSELTGAISFYLERHRS